MALGRLFAAKNLLNWLLLAVPVAVWLEFTHDPKDADTTALFVASCIGVIPLAGWMGKATEHLAARTGPGVGGLLNATFGNLAELIIALIALHKGEADVVKASITGSIIGNVLLVFGLSALAGGLRFQTQKFNVTAAGAGSTLLALSAVALLVPSIFHDVVGADGLKAERGLSFDISIVLLVTYALSLVFVLRTHDHLYCGAAGEHQHEEHDGPVWSVGKAVGVLVAATAGVGVMAEFLVGAVDGMAAQAGMNKVFIGVILVAIVGNAAEHSTAILVAMKNKMDLALNIAVGSSIQVALFVAPVLVLASHFMGPAPIDLHFTRLETLAVAVSVGIMALIAQDGESNWLEGVLLLAVYAILGMAFWFHPAMHG